MRNPSDAFLTRQIRDGEHQAFVTLVRRYERSLAALIRSRLGSVDAVDDVLQETLVHAWVSLRTTEPRNARAWLYAVARNRCTDYLRATEHRERAIEDERLAVLVDRLGIADLSIKRKVDEVVETFDALPSEERKAMRSFYVEGFSINEIASRHRSPPGTIKRRLSHGRDRVRERLGIANYRREKEMHNDSEITLFPDERPYIVVERLESIPSDVDMRELTWWFVVPELGDHVRWAEYQPIDFGSSWRLTRTNELRARHRAVIHEHDCIEIEVNEQWFSVDDVPVPLPEDRDVRVWGRLTDTEVQWVAVESHTQDGTRKLYTCLDDYFDTNFGVSERCIPAGEYLSAQSDGTFARREDAPELFVDGTFDVKIGASSYRCNRVIEMEKDATERGVVIMAYINASGRTVLFRRYDGKQRLDRSVTERLTKKLPYVEQFVIDGMTFIHSFDDLIAPSDARIA